MLNETVKQLNQRKAAIRKEIAALNAEDKKIDRAIAAITALPVTESATVEAKPAKKRKISAAGRKAIAAAVKARWAKINAGKAPAVTATPAATPVAKKGKMSAATKAKLAAAQKAYWAKRKAAKK